MRLIKKLNWLDPLIVASNVTTSEQNWAFLYSGMETKSSGNFSFLAVNQIEEITDSFESLEKALKSSKQTFENAWFGYFGYGMKTQLETLPEDLPSYINSDDMWFARFASIVIFDHKNRHIEVWENDSVSRPLNIMDILENPAGNHSPCALQISAINSNMTRAEYLQKVRYIKDAIKRGDLYQANLTRKFSGKIENQFRHFDIFRKLCSISPAPYSAFIKKGDLYIISSSPERFLQIDKNGMANIRPIKGSMARSDNFEEDMRAAEQLANSEKDRAENLMIVDLSRNDLARNCITGSIKVDELFSIESYATVHHMVSSISGSRKQGASTIELIKGCFPPGSMTGTPKIKAMEICSELEKMQRGIYSGAIGWLGGNGSADLSVVIRTIIMDGNNFEFQVGGAIVNDSTPEKELAETILKAKGVASALGISLNTLEGI